MAQLRVPLIAGASRRIVSSNIGALRKVGVAPAMATKIAYKEADRSGGYQRKEKRR